MLDVMMDVFFSIFSEKASKKIDDSTLTQVQKKTLRVMISVAYILLVVLIGYLLFRISMNLWNR